MAEIDTSTALLSIFGGGGGLLAAGVFLRDFLKGRALTDVNRDAAINGVGINQQVLNNLVDEVERMKQREIETAAKTEAREAETAAKTQAKEAELEARIAELEKRVDDLTTKLAKVRMVAIDCYALASKCDCEEGNEMLLNHLKIIIQEA